MYTVSQIVEAALVFHTILSMYMYMYILGFFKNAITLTEPLSLAYTTSPVDSDGINFPVPRNSQE